MKYRNIKTVIDGIKFSSKKEAKRYLELKEMQKRGEIKDLSLQPAFTFSVCRRDTNEFCLLRYRDSNRVLKYIADFAYTTIDEKLVIEDAKGFKTPEYKIKKSLMFHVHGIEVQEV